MHRLHKCVYFTHLVGAGASRRNEAAIRGAAMAELRCVEVARLADDRAHGAPPARLGRDGAACLCLGPRHSLAKQRRLRVAQVPQLCAPQRAGARQESDV
eukprot:2100595-Prymnesium_polylepis.1